MNQLYPQGDDFIHDNSKVRIDVKNWMKRQNFNLFKFTTYSSDLSPIENLCGTLKETVAKDNQKQRLLRKSLFNNWKISIQPESFLDILKLCMIEMSNGLKQKYKP